MDKDFKPNFRQEKAVAVTASFLALSGGTCDKYWLNKVMYFVERQSLVHSGQPIFFDELYSAPLGPIVSEINDGIDLAAYPLDSIWNRYFSLEGNTVRLNDTPDLSVLSDFEDGLIKQTHEKFAGWSFSKMHRFFHLLPENKETPSRESISYPEILQAEGFDPEVISETLDEISYLGDLENSLTSAPR